MNDIAVEKVDVHAGVNILPTRAATVALNFPVSLRGREPSARGSNSQSGRMSAMKTLPMPEQGEVLDDLIAELPGLISRVLASDNFF